MQAVSLFIAPYLSLDKADKINKCARSRARIRRPFSFCSREPKCPFIFLCEPRCVKNNIQIDRVGLLEREGITQPTLVSGRGTASRALIGCPRASPAARGPQPIGHAFTPRLPHPARPKIPTFHECRHDSIRPKMP